MSKPKCKLIGTDGNIFTLAGRVKKTLKKEGLKEQAEEFMALFHNCGSYDEAMRLIMEYMEVMSKPKCKLIGTDGNIFALAGRVQKTLKKEGLKEQAEEFMALLTNCGSYDEAIRLIMEYVEVE